MKKAVTMFLAFVLCFSLVLPSFAFELVDDTRACSLTLTYKREEETFENLEVKIYRIAVVNPNYTFDLYGDFLSYPVNIYGITSQAEWKNVADTLSSYIIADNLSPTASGKTDSEGKIKFENLTPALYLIMQTQVETKEGKTVFESFLTYLPYQNEDKSYNYDVEAFPKPQSHTPALEYKVIKQWKDNQDSSRPQSVKVEIFKDGVFRTAVTLSKENNWTFSWKVQDDGAVYTVVERDISEGYKVNITRNQNTFMITNINESSENPPPTADSVGRLPYIIAMAASGSALLLIAIFKKRGEA